MMPIAFLSLLFSSLLIQVSLATQGLLVECALPNSPSSGYAPEVVDCPKTKPTVRLANNLSDDESQWLSLRRNYTVKPMRRFLEKANITDFNVTSFFRQAGDDFTAIPNIGIAVSGGGYRALMNGAGFISAADSRDNDN